MLQIFGKFIYFKGEINIPIYDKLVMNIRNVNVLGLKYNAKKLTANELLKL